MKALRYGMVGIAILITVGIIEYSRRTSDSAAREPIENIEFNSTVQVAIEYGGDTSRAIMQMTVALLALLGGVLVATTDEAELLLGTWPERIIFIITGVLLAGSLWMFLLYSDGIKRACASGIVDKELAEQVEPNEKASSDRKKASLVNDEMPTYYIPDVFGYRFEIRYILQKGFFIAGTIVLVLLFATAHGLKRMAADTSPVPQPVIEDKTNDGSPTTDKGDIVTTGDPIAEERNRGDE